MPWARLLLWATALALAVWAAWLWPEVPDRVPVHFGAGGEPDRWEDRSVFSWFGLPALGLGLAAGLDALATWTRRHPESPFLNLPNKAAILALPPRQRAAVMREVAGLLYGVGWTCLLAIALIQVGVWNEAQGGSGQGWVLSGVLMAVLGPLAALVWGLVRTQGEVRRQRSAG